MRERGKNTNSRSEVMLFIISKSNFQTAKLKILNTESYCDDLNVNQVPTGATKKRRD